jgi:leucine-rich repeat protein SHOC2
MNRGKAAKVRWHSGAGVARSDNWSSDRMSSAELDARLAALPDGHVLPELRANNNQLTTVPANVLRFAPSLRLVALDSNLLHEAATLRGLSNLTSLSLAWNALTNVSFVVSLAQLRTLSLHHNLLTHLPAEVGALTALEHLDVACNRLSMLPDCRALFRLQSWVLERNPALPRSWQLSLWTRGEAAQLALEAHTVCATQRAVWCLVLCLNDVLPRELLRMIGEMLWRQRYAYFDP